ncbi:MULTISPECIES: hypothetical protein [unclassified Streptomyces]|uniref:hypothetical protein n=1 Tax=unclassified Streptomyces TaxID=2593676 RepID=UPI0035DB6E66
MESTETAQDTALALAQAGHTVAAALSYGIDAAAHHGAGAPTLAVMPCGVVMSTSW